jgi:hypothetical protein
VVTLTLMANLFYLVHQSLRCLNLLQLAQGDQKVALLFLALDRDLRCLKIDDLWEAQLSRVSRASIEN